MGESGSPQLDLGSKLHDLLFTRSKQWTFGRLPEDHVQDSPDAIGDKAVEAGKDYIGVNLRSMWIVNTRAKFTTFYPTLHSYIQAPAFIGGDVEFHVLTTPPGIKELTSKGLDRVIVGRQRLLGPIPYWGGSVTLQIALFSIKAGDLAAPFLSVLGDLSTIAGGGAFQMAAQVFSAPLKSGISMLTGTSGDNLEIGYYASADAPRTGYYLAIRREAVDLNNVWLKGGYLVDGRGQPFRDDPYFVFSIEASNFRPDWRSIPGLDAGWVRVKDAATSGDAKRLDQAFKKVRQLVVSSDDLLVPQMDQIVAELDARVARITSEVSGAESFSLGTSYDLADIQVGDGQHADDLTDRTELVDPQPVSAPGAQA
jgi:hypothetical protein